MRLHHLISTSLLSVALGTGMAFADGTRPDQRPAESYSAGQYVDKRGCLYERAAAGSGSSFVLSSEQPVCRKRTGTANVRSKGTTSRVRVGPNSAPVEIAESRAIKPPRGYRAAWDDGRLNPLKAVGTRHGQARMNVIWSTTVPRYELDPATGQRLR